MAACFWVGELCHSFASMQNVVGEGDFGLGTAIQPLCFIFVNFWLDYNVASFPMLFIHYAIIIMSILLLICNYYFRFDLILN